MRGNFLLNETIYNNLICIIEDTSFKISAYDIKPSYITEKLNWNSKIQLASANKILRFYNDYYNSDYKIEDIFNTDMLIWYTPDFEVEYKYIWDKSSFHRGIDKILQKVREHLWSIFWKSDDNKSSSNNKKNNDFQNRNLKFEEPQTEYMKLFLRIWVLLAIYFLLKNILILLGIIL